ncbi:hypothetical protein B0H16DRAFT_1310168 [Mycena metata]|uniref:Chitin synthase n=1 Tax=Mycena metata TaxID=1033252 RepID=A0AAD7JI15_9AGAR|nr:hypothetical protein B0H16DRAFT_1310168 [Mycena metata]
MLVQPGPTSIYHLWKAFGTNSNVGSACGGSRPERCKYGSSLINPLVAAQNFEYSPRVEPLDGAS